MAFGKPHIFDLAKILIKHTEALLDCLWRSLVGAEEWTEADTTVAHVCCEH